MSEGPAAVPTMETCARFWQMVAADEEALARQGGIELVEGLNAWIEDAIPGVGVEVAGDEGTRRELVLTAHGDVAAFATVQQLAACAPPLRHFTVVAFRARTADEFGMSMDGFELSGADVHASCSPDEGQVALEIGFAREIPMDFQECARHMAFIMLDHMLGEYDFAVKVGAVDFVERGVPDDAVSLGGLAARVDRCWKDDLGHEDRFPVGEQAWQSLRVELRSTGEEMLVNVNRSANAVLGRADLGWHLQVDLPATDRGELDAAQAFEDRLTGALEHGQRGLCTHVALRGGTRSMHWQVGDAGEASALAGRLLREAGLQATPATDYCPSWDDYRNWLE